MNTYAKFTLHAWRSASPSPIGWERAGVRAFFFGLMLFAFCSGATTAFGQAAAWVTTDAADYPPGRTVYISGGGFAAGETATCEVLHIADSGDNNTSTAHQPWTAVADDSGNISTTWDVPFDEDELGATLQLTATGQRSGLTTQTTFTDAGNVSVSITVGQSPNPVCPGSSAIYTVSVNEGGNPTDNTVTLAITTALPSGVTASFSPSTLSFTSNATKTSTLTLSTSSGTPAATTSFTIQAASNQNPPGTATGTGNLVVGASPSISAQPSSQIACAGSPITFLVTANNATGYQWQKNGTAISGATTSSYTISSAQAADAASSPG